MEKKPDLISVIVPVYNAEKYISDCVQSLLRQTYPAMEIILVDDGSKDNSFQICQELSERYDNVTAYHKENGGVASARNYGIQRSHGSFIGFMDNDDYIEPDMFETLITELKKTDAYVAQILVENVDEEFKPIEEVAHQKNYIEVISAHDYKKGLLLQQANLACWSKLFRREVLEAYTFVDGQWNEDMLLLFRIFSDPKFHHIISIDKIGYHYVQRRGSYSKNGFNQGYIDNLVNADWFLQQERDEELRICAYRLLFHQMIPYFLFAPMDYKKKHEADYKAWMERIKCDFKHWCINPYLQVKERTLLYGMMVCPELLRWTLEKINYKGYY